MHASKATEKLGLDQPVYDQYGLFMGRLLPIGIAGGYFETPSLGTAFATSEELNSTIIKAGRR